MLVLGPQRTKRITGNTLRISLQPDWQIDNNFLTGQSGTYSDPGTQVGAGNKDFGAVSPKDSTRV